MRRGRFAKLVFLVVAAVLIFSGASLRLAAKLRSGRMRSTAQSAAAKPRDGAHDFDWDLGTWKTHQRRLVHPLTGSTTWVEYSGTDAVRKIWDGANQGVIEADGTGGHMEIFTLRLYNPDSRQWSIFFTTPSGTMSLPVVGEFKDGRGDFYDQEAFNGRQIWVRFSVSGITKDACHFEQAFSGDGGKTWETNFVVEETLVKE